MRTGAEDVQVRLVSPEDAPAVATLLARVHEQEAATYEPLQAGLQAHGGRLPLDIPGSVGWCFGAYQPEGLVGVLYACTPVRFAKTFPPDQRAGVVRTIVELEILAVDPLSRQRGVGTTLVQRVDDHFAQLGATYLVAKVESSAMATMRWYRHRGYTLARTDEDLLVATPSGSALLNAGDSTRWRLAAKALTGQLARRGAGTWTYLTLVDE